MTEDNKPREGEDTPNDVDQEDVEASKAPVFAVMAQYIKDLSFENPNPPQSLLPQKVQPKIDLQLNINVRPLTGTDREVALSVNAKATVDENVLFQIELEFAALIRIANVPEDQIEVLSLVEAPRLLFPFVREIIASTTKNGGFSPVLLDPVDFAGLYRKRLAEKKAAEKAVASDAIN